MAEGLSTNRNTASRARPSSAQIHSRKAPLEKWQQWPGCRRAKCRYRPARKRVESWRPAWQSAKLWKLIAPGSPRGRAPRAAIHILPSRDALRAHQPYGFQSPLLCLQKLQGVSRRGIEWFVDDLQIDKLFIHGGPAFWIHLAELRAARIISGDEVAVPQLLPGKLHPLRIERGIELGNHGVGDGWILQVILPSFQ